MEASPEATTSRRARPTTTNRRTKPTTYNPASSTPAPTKQASGFSNAFTELTPATFAQKTDNADFILVTWCDESLFVCNIAIPELNKVMARWSSEQNVKVEAAYIRGADTLRRSFGVRKTPTVQLFINGGNHTFRKIINEAELFDWIKTKTEWWVSLNEKEDDDDKFFD